MGHVASMAWGSSLRPRHRGYNIASMALGGRRRRALTRRPFIHAGSFSAAPSETSSRISFTPWHTPICWSYDALNTRTSPLSNLNSWQCGHDGRSTEPWRSHWSLKQHVKTCVANRSPWSPQGSVTVLSFPLQSTRRRLLGVEGRAPRHRRRRRRRDLLARALDRADLGPRRVEARRHGRRSI